MKRSSVIALFLSPIFALVLSPSNLFAWGKLKGAEDPGPGPYVQEQNTPYRQAMQKIQQHIEQDKNENFKNMLLWKHIDKMEEDIRRAAEYMAKMKRLDQLITMIQLGRKGSTWSYEQTQPISDEGYFDKNKKPDGDTHEIKLEKEYITIKNSKVVVSELLMEAPLWYPPEKSSATPSSYKNRPSWGRIIKVSSQQPSSKQIITFENMLREISVTCLPDNAVKNFDPQKAAAWLFSRVGIVQKGGGIISRPKAPQDAVFRRFANLGCDDMSQTLFWSDPLVVNGYSAIFGTTLNMTMLKGYKSVDMDNVVSKGKSAEIDKQNRVLPPERQANNPFRAVAARTMPGLIMMGSQGRLVDGEPITNEQLTEAFNLSQKVKLLPSQKMAAQARKASFKFSYPPSILRVADSSANTDIVPLPELELEAYKRSMMMARDRLIDIQRLMAANRLSRQYVNEIVESLKLLIAEADATAALIQGLRDNGFSMFNRGDFVGDSPDGAIPEITMFRQAVLADLEYQRTVLSKLEHQHDDLKQKEWIMLEHILDVRKKGIEYLMNDASVRLNTEDINMDKSL